MKRIILFLFTVLLITSFKIKRDIYLLAPKSISAFKNCNAQETKLTFEVHTDSKRKIQVHSFKFNSQKFKLTVNGKLRSLDDVLFIRKKHPLKIEIEFIRDSTAINQQKITFKTNQNEYLNNTIEVNYGKYVITSDMIRKGKEKIIDFSKSCNDSLIIDFPYGGTVSNVSLHKSPSSNAPSYKHISYGIGDKNKSIKLNKSDLGRYYVKFGSCHWGNDFWLTIK